MNTLYFFALALTSTAAIAQPADFSACADLFPQKKIPNIIKKLPAGERLRPLCFDDFAVLHSGKSKTAVYAVEYVSRKTLAKKQERTDRFYEEARLPKADRATLADYRGSGYDRGHLAPAAQRQSPEGMAQSFSLANMVPQAPENNRGAWAKSVEKASRSYAQKANAGIYIYTGPLYKNSSPKTIGPGKVWVPDSLFKLVYDPGRNRAWAYLVENTDKARVKGVISYEELVSHTGIEFLPSIKLQ